MYRNCRDERQGHREWGELCDSFLIFAAGSEEAAASVQMWYSVGEKPCLEFRHQCSAECPSNKPHFNFLKQNSLFMDDCLDSLAICNLHLPFLLKAYI